MLRCAIVEDSPRELEHLKECLARYSAERDIPLETTAFGDAASFLEHYRADYDIVFMDIELPGINGMEASMIFAVEDVFVSRFAVPWADRKSVV